jgi:hypothetical protein
VRFLNATGDVVKLEHPHESSVIKEVRFPSPNTLYNFVMLGEEDVYIGSYSILHFHLKYLEESLFLPFSIAMNLQCHNCKWFLFADISNTS